MKHAFLLFVVTCFCDLAFAQQSGDVFTNKNLKDNVKTMVKRYVSFRDNTDGTLASVEIHRFNEHGLLLEKSMDFSGQSAFMSLKWVHRYNASGKLLESKLYNTRDQDGNEKLRLTSTDYYRYNSDGKQIERVCVDSKGDTTFRMCYEYDAAGFLQRVKSGGKEHYVETVYKNDEHGNEIETSTAGRKCTYMYDDNNRLVEQRWHDGLSDRVYQRQTSKYEDSRLIEKITYEGMIPETVATVAYGNFDPAGNYTKETWYHHGELSMMFEYVYTYN